MLACGLAWAQGADDSKPAPTNMPNAGYPRVHSDYRVTFRLEAPQARNAQLQPNIGAAGHGRGQGGFGMIHRGGGVWSRTPPPALAGFQYYPFGVGGLAVHGPGTHALPVGCGL